MSIPDLDRALHGMAESLMFLKRERCRDNGGPCDLFPMLHCFFEDGSQDVDLLLVDREAIPSALWDMQNDHGRLVYAGFLTDASVTLMSPASMLVVMLLDVAMNLMHEVHLPYAYRDDGQPRFAKRRRYDEPETPNLGRVSELLRVGAGIITDNPAPDDVVESARCAYRPPEGP
jgi:hypothetical protein